MAKKNDTSKKAKKSRLQQPAVGGSLPPAQQIREWERRSKAMAERWKEMNMPMTSSICAFMAAAYGECADLLERQ